MRKLMPMRWVVFALGLVLLSAAACVAYGQDAKPPAEQSPAVSVSPKAPPTPITERLRGFVGIAAILGLAYAVSSNRRGF